MKFICEHFSTYNWKFSHNNIANAFPTVHENNRVSESCRKNKVRDEIYNRRIFDSVNFNSVKTLLSQLASLWVELWLRLRTSTEPFGFATWPQLAVDLFTWPTHRDSQYNSENPLKRSQTPRKVLEPPSSSNCLSVVHRKTTPSKDLTVASAESELSSPYIGESWIIPYKVFSHKINNAHLIYCVSNL